MDKFKHWFKTAHFRPKLFSFLRWVIIDIYRVVKYGRKFREYGVTVYCGRQGYGKSVSMVEYLERMRKKYPKCLILTNFGYIHQTSAMSDWRDLLHVRNGEDGVIFAIDEIHSEYNSSAWKDFPEDLLSEVSQQRKQKVKIVCTAQVYTRMVKQLREQAFEVVECYTLLGRWTFMKAFDAYEYEAVVADPTRKNKLHRLWRRSFVQDDYFRLLFDSYKKIERMRTMEFIPRSERVI